MPFQYQNFRSPLTDSIAARIANQGTIEANRAQQSGNAWAGAVQGAGQAIAAIPGQIQQAKTQELESTLRGLQVQGAQRQQADVNALDQAYKSGGMDRNAIIDALPGHLRPSVQKQFTDADESALKVGKLKGEAAAAERDYFGSLAAGVQPFLNAEDHGLSAAMVALQHARENGYPAADKMWEQIKGNPQALPQMIEQLIASSPKQMELRSAAKTADARATQAQTGVDRLALETPKINAETQTAQQNAAGTQPITPYQQAELGNRAAALGVEKAKFGLEQQKFTQGQTDKTDLTPEGLDAAAMMFAKTGQLPALGMGDKTTRKAIINRAAALTPGLDLATAKADFTANSASLKNVTGTLDTLTSFEKTAGKNLDQFLALADKIPDTGVPWLNVPVRLLNDKMVGSANQAAANAARDVALREIARVTNDPKLSGVLSDSARHEVAGLSGKDATFAQIRSVARVLKQDMANVHESLTEQQGAIQGRIKLGGPSATMQKPIPGIAGGMAESTDGGKTWTRIK